jgi:hypothetical protein
MTARKNSTYSPKSGDKLDELLGLMTQDTCRHDEYIKNKVSQDERDMHSPDIIVHDEAVVNSICVNIGMDYETLWINGMKVKVPSVKTPSTKPTGNVTHHTYYDHEKREFIKEVIKGTETESAALSGYAMYDPATQTHNIDKDHSSALLNKWGNVLDYPKEDKEIGSGGYYSCCSGDVDSYGKELDIRRTNMYGDRGITTTTMQDMNHAAHGADPNYIARMKSQIQEHKGTI